MNRFLLALAIPLLAFSLASAQGTAESTAEAEEAKMAESAEPPTADAEPPTVLDALTVCREVEERKPVGAADTFSSDVGTLYCFTKVVTKEAPLQLFHRWYVGDKLVDEIPINVKGESWRCWSRKTIVPAWNGPCRVEILNESGDVLGVHEFALAGAAKKSAKEPAEKGGVPAEKSTGTAPGSKEG